jgi:hypothetical protein
MLVWEAVLGLVGAGVITGVALLLRVRAPAITAPAPVAVAVLARDASADPRE